MAGGAVWGAMVCFVMEAYKGMQAAQAGAAELQARRHVEPNEPPPLPKKMTHFICTTSVPICLSFISQKGATPLWSLRVYIPVISFHCYQPDYAKWHARSKVYI